MEWSIVYLIIIYALIAAVSARVESALPTNYEYYTEGGVTSGLDALADGFRLNNKNITILSGAMHYFRVHPKYWRDRLRKLRAMGANTVETYVPWNLHEPSPGIFDFGQGADLGDMSRFLDLARFLHLAQAQDLLVIVRPGPYICAEWEFGGLPSWLLRDRDMKVRTSDPRFEHRVRIYFTRLLPILGKLQFTSGGPIIAFQIENEYGSVKSGNAPLDRQYLLDLHALMKSLGLHEMFFTSDNSEALESSVPAALRTVNLATNPEEHLERLKRTQSDRPLMVMEFWTGWFDKWTDSYHNQVSVEKYSKTLRSILSYPASVNLYMFHGGTTWGFLNGDSVVTSYDYDAPLTEAGDYTAKYNVTQKLFAEFATVQTRRPERPAESLKTAYPAERIKKYLSLEGMIEQIPPSQRFLTQRVTSMEELDLNAGAGQRFGYVLYRRHRVALGNASTLKITGRVHGIATVLVDGHVLTPPLTSVNQLHGFGYWTARDAEMVLKQDSPGRRTLDILVENPGRTNFGPLGQFDDRKGLFDGPVLVDGVELRAWEIIAMQFDGAWIRSLSCWRHISDEAPTPTPTPTPNGPALYFAYLEVDSPINDTFLDMSGWGKGVVFVNGFNLGRYTGMGPVRTLYLPAPLLSFNFFNEIVVFEEARPASHIVFTDKPIYGNGAETRGRRHPLGVLVLAVGASVTSFLHALW